jgi:periplasmic divalent cation tolerance protein
MVETAGGRMEPTGAVIVYVTVPDLEAGEKLGRSLVETKLAACVNIVPGITSIYQWNSEVQKDSELLLMIKSRETLVRELTSHVKENHPYDECEVISVPITGGSESYLKWVMDSTKAA